MALGFGLLALGFGPGAPSRNGHYEDELVKVNGQWLFTKRRIYNEQRAEWAYQGGKSPAW